MMLVLNSNTRHYFYYVVFQVLLIYLAVYDGIFYFSSLQRTLTFPVVVLGEIDI